MLSQLYRKITNALAASFNFVNQVEAAGKIDDRAAECFVHRHQRCAVTSDPDFVGQRIAKCLTQTDGNVFDRMMIVHVKVTAAIHFEIELAMTRKQRQHVIEKRNAGYYAR